MHAPRQNASPAAASGAVRPLQHRALCLLIACAASIGNTSAEPAKTPTAATGKPALTVSATTPQTANWPYTLAANGNVAAWQEAVIGAEIAAYRITEVRVDVGDRVKKGQVLLRLASETLHSELAEARASVAEIAAQQNEARANGERARRLQDKGFYSPQQSTQYLTAEASSEARLNAARARLQAASLRLDKATIVAPDDGIISARSAAVGSLTQAGQELFRLIRGARLEWRAEVTASELTRLKPGLGATLTAPDGTRIEGRVRALAPTVDAQTRNALVYVDLPATSHGSLRAGMFVRGEFSEFRGPAETGKAPTLTLPSSAVLLRDGFSWVFRIDGTDGGLGKVTPIKVDTGRQSGDRIEITGGLPAGTRVVNSGAGFLADGDTVRIVADPAVSPGSKP